LKFEAFQKILCRHRSLEFASLKDHLVLVCSEKNKTEEALKLLSEAMTQARDAKTSRGSERIAAFKQAKQLSQRVIDMPLPTDASYERLSLCIDSV
jgi:hypothetical protein